MNSKIYFQSRRSDHLINLRKSKSKGGARISHQARVVIQSILIVCVKALQPGFYVYSMYIL